jgi:hypothetical protein
MACKSNNFKKKGFSMKTNSKVPVTTNKFGKIVAVGGALALTAQNAMADLTVPTALNISSVESVGAIVVVGVAAIWAIRKAIGLLR